MKKMMLCALMMMVAICAKAQFEAGTKYVGISATNLGLSYSSSERFRLGLEANAGYFVADKVMLRANISYNHTRIVDDFALGVGGRYYFRENGIFMGAGAEFCHFTSNNNDVQVPIELGYAFYLNHYITVEPALYYKMSLDDFSDKSTVGLKIGFGVYF